jgi:hypothetical protein
MNKMITSGQKGNAVDVIASAARKGGTEAIEELSEEGKLNSGNFQRVLAQGYRVGAAVKIAVKTVLTELADDIVGCLKRIFTDRVVELAATDGSGTLADAGDVFNGGIFGAVKRRKPCKATKKTAVAIYHMIKDGEFQAIFGGFGENLKRLCWTEDQIVAFCRNHYPLLQREYVTFFLFEEEDGDFFVCSVRFDSRGCLLAVIDPIKTRNLWRAKCQHRVVVPDYGSVIVAGIISSSYKKYTFPTC